MSSRRSSAARVATVAESSWLRRPVFLLLRAILQYRAPPFRAPEYASSHAPQYLHGRHDFCRRMTPLAEANTSIPFRTHGESGMIHDRVPAGKSIARTGGGAGRTRLCGAISLSGLREPTWCLSYRKGEDAAAIFSGRCNLKVEQITERVEDSFRSEVGIINIEPVIAVTYCDESGFRTRGLRFHDEVLPQVFESPFVNCVCKAVGRERQASLRIPARYLDAVGQQVHNAVERPNACFQLIARRVGTAA